METDDFLRLFCEGCPLKNFIKGMETEILDDDDFLRRFLKNFLKGMETSISVFLLQMYSVPQKLP